MNGFTSPQLKALLARLDRARVQSREIGGRRVDYIEGWFAIAEANAIFGYAGWDREMAQFERVFERVQGKMTNCGYLARVRIRVRARGTVVIREGTGFGHAFASTPDEAHERALKAAETDATKRALATFGNRFGLGLYDKEQIGVGDVPPTTAEPPVAERQQAVSVEPRNTVVLKTDDGKVLATGLSPEAYCSGLRQMIETSRVPHEVEGLRGHNGPTIALLREAFPGLKTPRGKHYADILDALMEQRASELARAEAAGEPSQEPDTGKGAFVPPPVTAPLSAETNGVSERPAPPQPARLSRLASGPAIDKSLLAVASPRRIRNKAHLGNVGAKPCLICEEVPCHAHHVTFAQPRGLSVKVSDEYTVPLCALHHNEVHRTRPEETWWRRYGIDPLSEALRLWQESLGAFPLDETKPRDVPKSSG